MEQSLSQKVDGLDLLGCHKDKLSFPIQQNQSSQRLVQCHLSRILNQSSPSNLNHNRSHLSPNNPRARDNNLGVTGGSHKAHGSGVAEVEAHGKDKEVIHGKAEEVEMTEIRGVDQMDGDLITTMTMRDGRTRSSLCLPKGLSLASQGFFRRKRDKH
jgi:hypothetical protein